MGVVGLVVAVKLLFRQDWGGEYVSLIRMDIGKLIGRAGPCVICNSV